jgi:uncharacterized protein YjbI with pentapeptide repeats
MPKVIVPIPLCQSVVILVVWVRKSRRTLVFLSPQKILYNRIGKAAFKNRKLRDIKVSDFLLGKAAFKNRKLRDIKLSNFLLGKAAFKNRKLRDIKLSNFLLGKAAFKNRKLRDIKL